MDNNMNIKAKLQAIVNIINEMDDMELKDMTSSEEEEPKKITMVSIKAKPMGEEDMMEEGEPAEDTKKDQMEDVAEGEAPETEEEEDPQSALGRLRKRLQGAI
jgi:hypothetical protein